MVMSSAIECGINSENAADISLAHSLGLRTSAKEVDKPGQLDSLRAEGCFADQSDLFNQLLPAGKIAKILWK